MGDTKVCRREESAGERRRILLFSKTKSPGPCSCGVMFAKRETNGGQKKVTDNEQRWLTKENEGIKRSNNRQSPEARQLTGAI